MNKRGRMLKRAEKLLQVLKFGVDFGGEDTTVISMFNIKAGEPAQLVGFIRTKRKIEVIAHKWRRRIK